jgi:site-specific recombinase XerD
MNELISVATGHDRPDHPTVVDHPLDRIDEDAVRRVQVLAAGLVEHLSRQGQVHTARTYEKRLRVFLRWLADHAGTMDWSPACLQAYRTYLHSHPSIRSTLAKNGYLTAVRQLTRYVAILGFARHDPGLTVKGWKASGRHRRLPLSYEDAQAWLAALEQDPRKTELERRRNTALGYLLIKTGLRTCEAAGADLAGLRQDPTGRWMLQIRGKGQGPDERDWVRCVPAVMDKLSAYFALRGVQPGESGPLFASLPVYNRQGRLMRPGGQPISSWTIHRVLTEALVLAGVKRPGIVVHSLRHSAATYALLNGAPPQTVQAMMRHRSYRTTQLYVTATHRLLDGAEDYITQL